MNSLVADTNAVIWYLATSPRLSEAARSAMSAAEQRDASIFVASISLLEIIRIHRETAAGRRRATNRQIPADALASLIEQLSDPSSAFKIAPLDLPTARAAEGCFFDDPGDWIIAATALHLGLPLVTADETLRASKLIPTIW